MLQNPHVLLTFDKVHNPLRLPRKNGIWTSKSAPNPSVFYTFDFDVCFAPQRRVLLRHLNFQKNVRRGTTACTFFDIATSKSGAKLRCFVHFDFEMCFAPQQRALFRHHNFQKWRPKVVRGCFVLYILALKCAPAALASLLFNPPGPQITNHWKNWVFRNFPTSSRTWIFFLLRLSLFWSSFFFSALLWLFPTLLFICPYCRKFDF